MGAIYEIHPYYYFKNQISWNKYEKEHQFI